MLTGCWPGVAVWLDLPAARVASTPSVPEVVGEGGGEGDRQPGLTYSLVCYCTCVQQLSKPSNDESKGQSQAGGETTSAETDIFMSFFKVLYN